jgi:hypothetical protein
MKSVNIATFIAVSQASRAGTYHRPTKEEAGNNGTNRVGRIDEAERVGVGCLYA